MALTLPEVDELEVHCAKYWRQYLSGAPVRKSCGIRCNAINGSAVGLKDGGDRLRVPLECCQQAADALAIQRLNSIVRLRFKINSLLVTITGEVPGGFDEAQRLSGDGCHRIWKMTTWLTGKTLNENSVAIPKLPPIGIQPQSSRFD